MVPESSPYHQRIGAREFERGIAHERAMPLFYACGIESLLAPAEDVVLDECPGRKLEKVHNVFLGKLGNAGDENKYGELLRAV